MTDVAFRLKASDPRQVIRCNLLLVGCSGILAAGCFAENERGPSSGATCHVALDYIKKVHIEADRPIAVETQRVPEQPSERDLIDLQKERPDLKSHPDFQQAMALVSIQNVNVLDRCPDIRSWLVAERILHDDRTIERLRKTMDWPIIVVSIGAPVISQSGDRITFYASEYSGLLGGGSMVVHYRRDAQRRWKYHAAETLTIS